MSKNETPILFAICSKCKSGTLKIYFDGDLIGGMCVKCKSIVFETNDLPELIAVARNNQTDKKPTIEKRLIRKKNKTKN